MDTFSRIIHDVFGSVLVLNPSLCARWFLSTQCFNDIFHLKLFIIQIYIKFWSLGVGKIKRCNSIFNFIIKFYNAE